jgi:hypothetical protein
MNKTVACCIGLALFLIAPAALSPAADMDVVVMVDVTWSLTDQFNDIEQYLLGTLLTDVLKDGDTFHLLWFSDHPETLITGTATDRQSRETFRARLKELRNYQYLYGHYTDLVAAVAYLVQFTEKLPKDHQKLIILVTDGINDPPPGSKDILGQKELEQFFLSQAEEIKKNGWSLHILKTLLEKQGARQGDSTPFFKAFPDSGNTNVVPFTQGQKENLLIETAELARIVFPGPLGTVGKKALIPFVVRNGGKESLRLTLTAVKAGGRNILVQPAEASAGPQSSGALNATVEFPDDLADGEQRLAVTLEFKDTPRLVGTTGELLFTYQKSLPPPLVNFNQNMNLGVGVFPLWAVLLALLGLVVLLILVLVILSLVRHRGFHFSVRRTLGADAIGRRARFGYRRLTEYNKTPTHSFAVEMIVGMQRRHIGQRNIRTIRRNRSLTVGGGRSAFLVFLVPVPQKIARISYDGEDFTFTPVKGEFFPGLEGEVPKCLNKEIHAVSKKNYPLDITFQRYVSPMEEITAVFNRLKEQSNVKGA